jgi:hypothetical protein
MNEFEGKGNKPKTSVVDRHRFFGDPDPDPTFHFDADPGPDADPQQRRR